MKEKILIADDEESIRFTFSSFLSAAGYQVETVATLPRCIQMMESEKFDLLFLDIRFGVDDGIEAIRGLKLLQPDCAVVVMTGGPDATTISQARQSGALDYLVKPVRQTSLLYIAQKTLVKAVDTRH